MPQEDKYFFIGESAAETVQKKSRFIAHMHEVHTEKAALEYIEEQKKRFYDARHNCYAYVCGINNDIQRFSDDGEPSGTAGRPILDILLKNNVRNAVIVVTRYFGGILLGTGGLVRAYSEAADAALRAGLLCPAYSGYVIRITCSYNDAGKIQYMLEKTFEQGARTGITDINYTESVEMDVICEDPAIDSVCRKVTELSSGRAAVQKQESVMFVMQDGKPVTIA